MERITLSPRPGWQEKLESLGFSFHSSGGSYWDESACYRFTPQEIDHLEEVTAELHDMCLNAVAYVIGKNLFPRLGIAEPFAALVKRSWERRDPSLYGRFDFSYDGKSEPRLLEYNADTPTSLLEASVAQWTWLEEIFPRQDQFNSIHEKLLEGFKALSMKMPVTATLYFGCVKDQEEDLVTLEYLRDAASQLKLFTKQIFIEEIGYSPETGKFYDLENREIQFLFKLYPWEWLMEDEFGAHLLKETVQLFEPPWKMVLSNKGILPILWEMYPNHPNLLESCSEAGRLNGAHVRKPLFSREGANIAYHEGGTTLLTEGSYGTEGYIYQEAKPLPDFDGNYPVIGSWVVNGQPAGIGIREDNSPITRNTSRFVPHYFIPSPAHPPFQKGVAQRAGGL